MLPSVNGLGHRSKQEVPRPEEDPTAALDGELVFNVGVRCCKWHRALSCSGKDHFVVRLQLSDQDAAHNTEESQRYQAVFGTGRTTSSPPTMLLKHRSCRLQASVSDLSYNVIVK